MQREDDDEVVSARHPAGSRLVRRRQACLLCARLLCIVFVVLFAVREISPRCVRVFLLPLFPATATASALRMSCFSLPSLLSRVARPACLPCLPLSPPPAHSVPQKDALLQADQAKAPPLLLWLLSRPPPLTHSTLLAPPRSGIKLVTVPFLHLFLSPGA